MKLKQKHVNKLNDIIHSKGLYGNASRFICAQLTKGKITVENLMTEERVEFSGDGFRNGYGSPVTLEDLA